MRCSPAGADFARRRRQHLHRPRDAFGEIQAHPGRTHQDEQRDHDEERQVDAGQRLLQHAELRVVFVVLGHAAGAIGHLAGEHVACEHDAHHPPVRGADRLRDAQQFAAGVGHRLEIACRSRSRARRDGRPRPRRAGRQARIRDVEHRRRGGAVGDAAYLHERHAPAGHVGRDDCPHRVDVGEIDARERLRHRDASSLTTRCRSR
jgi:hypothetical protein